MTDDDKGGDGPEIEDLVDDAVGDMVWPTPLSIVGATVDTEPTTLDPADREQFVPFDLTQFLNGKSLWAANYFVLWPMGLALTVDVATEAVDASAWCGDDKVHVEHKRRRGKCLGARVTDEVTNLHVRHWVFPNDELGETINQEQAENQGDYEVFLAFVRDRLLNLKPDERHILVNKFNQHGIASAEQILVAS